MTLRKMRLDDLERVLGWAADEGWNPGQEDAAAFYAADPEGFLIKEVDGAPVAAISVVNHDPEFAFLGLYLCKPDYRGLGYGMEVWRAGIAHAGERNIGLDGVPDQQANYARSGFAKYGRTVRYEGQISAASDPRIRRASPEDMPTLIARDADACGISRRAFATTWVSECSTRQTMVLWAGADITGFATFRRCRVGSKIGPLYAASETDALALLASNPFASSDAPSFVDVLEQGSAFATLLAKNGFDPVFETARMYRGVSPETKPARFQAIATMELG